MSDFNEIQSGIPDLGKTYWQELKSKDNENSSLSDIVKINCQTIFNAATFNKTNKRSIFNN